MRDRHAGISNMSIRTLARLLIPGGALATRWKKDFASMVLRTGTSGLGLLTGCLRRLASMPRSRFVILMNYLVVSNAGSVNGGVKVGHWAAQK